MKKIVLSLVALAVTAGVMAQDKNLGERKKAEVTKPAATTSATKTTGTPPQKVKVVEEAKPIAPAPDQAGPSPDEVIKVNTVKHDFGKIKQGVPVTYSFEIRNTSNKPIVVENSYASCGCTTPEKIVEPIAPGATAKLKVQYNAASPGPFTKDVHIKLAGIAQEKIVHITGEVVAATPSN